MKTRRSAARAASAKSAAAVSESSGAAAAETSGLKSKEPPAKDLSDVGNRRKERLERLQQQMHQAQILSRRDVAEDAQRKEAAKAAKARPAAGKRRREAETLVARQIATEQDVDYARARALDWSQQTTEAWDARQAALAAQKVDALADSSTEQAARYARDVAQLAKQPKRAARSGPERVAQAALEAQAAQAKRARTRHATSSEINYINDDNARFNRKLARHYDRYTADMQASFERGTAL